MGSRTSQLASVGTFLVLAFSAPAYADEPPAPPPPGTPSISQYVETVPTSSGGAAPGVGRKRAKALPPRVATRLRQHPDALTHRLTTIATSSSYGAPQRALHSKTVGPGQRGKEPSEPSEPSSLSAAVNAVSDTGDSHVFWLLGAILVLTSAMVWTAARRHRV
jgi:hypothetical protein